ncbi:type II toxin-antitoxin system HicA family toxin [Embleya sp. NPDC059237]|uniref:type II toxin-antitoxin system HicA family toxin n=1 Tax=Embleya sp. NPDC059237 TaxID=3346784 RepID=UPI0036C9AA06
MSAKDIKKLIKALEAQGFTVVRTKGNHYKVYKGGRLITTLPFTPSDHRSILNCIAVLRRAGFVG